MVFIIEGGAFVGGAALADGRGSASDSGSKGE